MNDKDLLDIRTICFDCAKAHGFVMKDKAVGVWTDKCEVCHERKPCTNLHHDWRKKGKGGTLNEKR